MPLTLGNTLHHGKYLINHILGQTDIGATFQGTLVLQNRPVILKVLQPNSNLGVDVAQSKQRFFDQIQRFAQCKHPGLVRLIDSFEEEDAAIAVLDYTAGPTLLEVVHTKGALAESQAVQYIQQVGSALTELHDKGLIHRSVTPKNVIRPIGSDIVVLVNVGLLDSTVLGIAADRKLPMGEYAAIEQHQAQLAHTPATDIYALAGTLYFLLTGYAPLAAPLRHRSPLPSPRQLCPHLTCAVESAILRGLELNANSRPQAIAEWLALLPSPVSPSDRDSNSVLDASVLNATVPQAAAVSQAVIVASSKPNSLPAKSASLPTQRFSQSNRSMTPSTLTPKNIFPKTLLTIGAIAAVVGLGAGLSLRVTANSTGPGTSIFHTEQAFPSFENWPGVAPPTVPSSSYSPPAVEAPNQRKEPAIRYQSPLPAVAPSVEAEASPKPAVEDLAPPALSPQVPVTNPTPNAIAPTPNIPNTPEPELPPVVIPPPPPAEIRPEPEPALPPSMVAPSSSEVQRQ